MTTFIATDTIFQRTAQVNCARCSKEHVTVTLSQIGTRTRSIVFKGVDCKRQAWEFIKKYFEGYEFIKE